MTRYRDMNELRGVISPDVLSENQEEFEKRENKRKIEEGVGASLDQLIRETKRKHLEDEFLYNWDALGGPKLEREYRFHEKRLWRLDFAAPHKKIAIEIQGGLYRAESGHRSKDGVERDYEKINEAQFAGWQVFQVTSTNVKDSDFLEKLIKYVQEARVR